jgi:methylated-DNA-[protein]-cysteine S-methyltransferase
MKSRPENYHLIFDTEFGSCLLLFKNNPFVITRFVLPDKNEHELETKVSPELWGIPGKNREAMKISRKIINYFAGDYSFTLCPAWHLLNTETLTILEIDVLKAVVQIPYGRVCSYKDIAVSVGRPLAYRFVGSTMAKNPFPVLIPCHRVIRNDMSIGQYGGGQKMKKKLIELEAKNGVKLNF